jgi:hypothetical protein
VTRFSPIGRLFTLGSDLKKYRSGANFWPTIFYGTSYVLDFLRKIGWAKFWATF